MKISKSKILTQFTTGIFGGTILGITGFVSMMTYGGNNGCWTFMDTLFGTRGYESCGSFGALSGVILGTTLGILIISMIKIPADKNMKIGILMVLATVILPFLFAIIVFWPPFVRSEDSGIFFEDYDFLLAIPTTIIFVILSAIPSGLITIAINFRKLFNKEP